MGLDPLAAGSLQGAEQPIAPRIVVSLSLGHGGILELPATLGSARPPCCGGRSLFVRPLLLRGCTRLTTFRIDVKMHGISRNAEFQEMHGGSTDRLCDEDLCTLSR
jgi:hypothetical protein